MSAIPFDVDQAGWGAQRRFPDGALSGTWVPDKSIIHYGGNASPAADAPYSQERERWALRVYEQAHLSRGWRAIGYNYAVGQTGTRYRLRGENPSGATSGDFEGDGIPENAEGRAILWIGGLGQELSPAARVAMASMVIPGGDVVIPHSAVKHTTNCPGDEWREWIADEGWKADMDQVTHFQIGVEHPAYEEVSWLLYLLEGGAVNPNLQSWEMLEPVLGKSRASLPTMDDFLRIARHTHMSETTRDRLISAGLYRWGLEIAALREAAYDRKGNE